MVEAGHRPYLARMRYGEGLLEEIRRRTDLVQLVGRRVKLVRKGRVMWGCCPFHEEKSAQLQGRERRRTYTMLRLRQGRRRLSLADGNGRPVVSRSGAKNWPARRASNCPNGRPRTKRASRRRNRSMTSWKWRRNSIEEQLRADAGRRGARLSEVARPGRRGRETDSAWAMRRRGTAR